MRSAAVLVFIALIAAAGVYCAMRPTVAKGDVLGAELVEANPLLEHLDCDDRVPIGLAGATFDCKARFKNGDTADYKFGLDRNGHISVVEESKTRSAPLLKKTDDPWGE